MSLYVELRDKYKEGYDRGRMKAMTAVRKK